MNLKNRLLENTEVLLNSVRQLSDSKLNYKLDEQNWSVAEIVEHLYRSEYGIPRLFNGETQKEIDRAPDAYVDEMRKKFLESDKKMKASGVILPTEGKKSKETLISKFQENREIIADLIDKFAPNELCLSFKHPIFGYLTRLEWIHFNIIHIERHLGQIKRVISQLD
ncbi:MAG: DinB family protein [Gracilimonas sp.]